MQEYRPRWSSHVRIVISLLVLAFFLYLVYRFNAILKPLILAIVLAFVLSPLANRLESRFRLPRALAVVLTYLLMLVLVAAVPLVIIPPFVSQFTGLNLDLQRILLQIESLLASQYNLGGILLDTEAIFQQLIVSLQGVFEPLVGQTLGLAVEAVTSIVWMIFILVVGFYLIKDAPALRSWMEGLPPPDYRQDFINLRDEIGQIWAAFFRGQMLLALVVAIIFTVIGFILGLPFALVMGVFAGVLEFLPSFGHGIWLVTASLLALFGGSTWLPLPNWILMLIIIGLHLFFQQFDLNYLIPRIIGRRVHLPPLVVILGVVAGAMLGGVLGILLAAPTIASTRVLGRYIFANLFDQNPFPDSPAPPLPPPDPRWWRAQAGSKKTSVSDEPRVANLVQK